MISNPIEPSVGAGNPSQLAWVALAAIILFAGAIRFIGLEDHPNGLFRDEAEKGYNAWALMESGGVIEFRAETPGGPVGPVLGHPKMFVNVMGSQTPVIYHWMAVPFIKLFGLNARSTRMPAAFAGTLAVALLGCALLSILSSSQALTITMWLAICPWHYAFSRWAQQGIFVTVGIAGSLGAAAALYHERKWAFPLMGFSLGFCFYVYTGAQPFVLAYGVLLGWLYRRDIQKQILGAIVGCALALIWIVPTLAANFLSGDETRLARVAVWNAPDATLLNSILRVGLNWISHYNPIFLFIRGDSLARHGIPGLGQLLLVDALLLPVGIYYAYRNRIPLRNELLLMLIAAPAGAAITYGHIPHALRAMPIVIPCAIFSGIGIIGLRDLILRQSESKGTSAWLSHVFLIAVFSYAMRIFMLYWSLSATDPRFLDREIGFSSSYANAFSNLAEHPRQANQPNVQVDARIPYAPYYYYFNFAIPPSTISSDMTSVGLHLYDPMGRIAPPPKELNPGDGIIQLNADGEAEYFVLEQGNYTTR